MWFHQKEKLSFWWNHTRSPENFKGGSVRHGSVSYGSVRHAPVRRYKPPEGSPEGVPFSEASSRAKREAPPRLHPVGLHRGSGPREGHREVGGRYKKTQKGSTRKPRGTTYQDQVFSFYDECRNYRVVDLP